MLYGVVGFESIGFNQLGSEYIFKIGKLKNHLIEIVKTNRCKQLKSLVNTLEWKNTSFQLVPTGGSQDMSILVDFSDFTKSHSKVIFDEKIINNLRDITF